MAIYIDSTVLEPGDIFYAADTEGLVAAFQVTPEGDITELDIPDAVHQRYVKALEKRQQHRDKFEVVEAFESGALQVTDDEA